MKALHKSATENLEVTYQLLEEDFFVASGFTPEGNIFYRRSDLLNGVVYNFLLEYPQEDGFIYDSITTQISNSYTLPIASFDCDLAATESEKLICGISSLSLYDSRIAKSYTYLQENLPTNAAEKLKNQQRNWLQSRRDACNQLTGETIFTCHSEEMFTRAEYLSVFENMQKDFDYESYSLVESNPCKKVLTQSAEDYLEANNAFATQPYARHLTHWSYCFGQEALLKHAFSSSDIELRSYTKLRNSLVDLMGAYNFLRSAQSGGGTMFIMLHADGQQWVETEFAYILNSYKSNPNKIPESVLKRSSLALNPTTTEQFAALEAATDQLESKLSYTADYLLDCCSENYDPYYLDEFKDSIEQAKEDIKTGLDELIMESKTVDLYVMHEVFALADDMYHWFDIR